jgi:hypothetical protein
MSDPLILVAAGAAVGGVASGLTKKAWESGERWLCEKFGSHTVEAQERARENAAAFVHQLAVRVAHLEKHNELSSKSVADTQSDPQFSALLQKTLLNAAKTKDETKHALLAHLVAIRLTSDAETTISLASELASDAIARSTKRQLTLMALCDFLEEIFPRHPIPTPELFHKWLEVHLKPFVDFEFVDMDAYHLVAIACASFDPSSDYRLAGVFLLKAGRDLIEKLHNDDFEHIGAVRTLRISWDMGLAGVRLTSVGRIVGGLALGHIKGLDLGPPKWP